MNTNNTLINERRRFFSKNRFINFAKILIAGGLLYYLIQSVKYDQIIDAVSQVNLILIFTVLLLGIVNVYLQYFKWGLTCSEVLEVNDKSKVLRSLFYGFSAGIITPLRVGEYFGRGIEFKNRSLFQVTIATLVDKFFPLLMVASIGSVSSLIFVYVYYDVSIYIVLSLFILIFTLFYVIILLMINPSFWNNVLFSQIKKSRRMRPLLEKLKPLEHLDRTYFYKMLLISFLFYSCYLIQYALLVVAFSHNSEFVNYLWAGNLIMFTKTIIPPISFGELGIREGASVFFITQLGEVASIGFNASIFLFLINLVLPAIIGVGMFLRKNDN